MKKIINYFKSIFEEEKTFDDYREIADKQLYYAINNSIDSIFYDDHIYKLYIKELNRICEINNMINNRKLSIEKDYTKNGIITRCGVYVFPKSGVYVPFGKTFIHRHEIVYDQKGNIIRYPDSDSPIYNKK